MFEFGSDFPLLLVRKLPLLCYCLLIWPKSSAMTELIEPPSFALLEINPLSILPPGICYELLLQALVFTKNCKPGRLGTVLLYVTAVSVGNEVRSASFDKNYLMATSRLMMRSIV